MNDHEDVADAKPNASRIYLRGTSFGAGDDGSGAVEINTHDEVVIDSQETVWTSRPLGSRKRANPIQSNSHRVRGFMTRVANEKLRIARSQTTRPPIPKPAKRTFADLPPHTPVPCPLCRPNATPETPGEPYDDCEICDGSGTVSAKIAATWVGDLRLG